MTFTIATIDDIKYVLLVIMGLIVAALATWKRMSKARTDTAVDTADRRRLTDALDDAAVARKEAHGVKNEMMGMQRRMGRLESDNENCIKENEQLRIRIKTLEAQVEKLMGKKTFTPTASDIK